MWLGIDFSGNAAMWSAGCGRSNVWIATLEETEGLPVVSVLRQVQGFSGPGHPFDRLARLLGDAGFKAAAIDAPFSLPAPHIPAGGHRQLLRDVDTLPKEGRPFARGRHVADYAMSLHPIAGLKPLRATERGQGINIRSTLWCGARGGAPFTAACLTLLHAAGRAASQLGTTS
jgi:hypothetical protein